ncbi:MAG TPA: hypothetical protein ENK50_00500 [Sedimenticola sp.]|nr:hypothetical protein [Sedimenticola sp.]
MFLLQQGLGVEQIADRRGLTPATVYTHLGEAIGAGLLDAREVLPLDAVAYREIVQHLELLETCRERRLKPLFEALEGRHGYELLRCIVAQECR